MPRGCEREKTKVHVRLEPGIEICGQSCPSDASNPFIMVSRGWGIVVIEREPNADSADCGQGTVLYVVRTEYTARSSGNCSLISLPLVTLATVGLVPRGLLSLAQVAARLRRGYFFL
jgi:hypothetical protein